MTTQEWFILGWVCSGVVCGWLFIFLDLGLGERPSGWKEWLAFVIGLGIPWTLLSAAFALPMVFVCAIILFERVKPRWWREMDHKFLTDPTWRFASGVAGIVFLVAVVIAAMALS